jgi:hypothetical protein
VRMPARRVPVARGVVTPMGADHTCS